MNKMAFLSVLTVGLVLILTITMFPKPASALVQPNNLGVVAFSYSTMTYATIAAYSPSTIGYPVWCTDCTSAGAAGTLCTSTGTGRGALILSTGTACR